MLEIVIGIAWSLLIATVCNVAFGLDFWQSFIYAGVGCAIGIAFTNLFMS